MAGGRSDRHTKDRQAKTDPIKGQEACLLLTGINELIADGMSFEEMLAGALIKAWAGTWTMPLSMEPVKVSLLVL